MREIKKYSTIIISVMNVNCKKKKKKEIYEKEPQKRNITHLVGRSKYGPVESISW